MEVTYCGFYSEFIVYDCFYLAINNEPDYMPSQKEADDGVTRANESR